MVITISYVVLVTIVVVEQECRLAAAWCARVRIGTTRIIQRSAHERDASGETEQRLWLVNAGRIVHQIIEKNVQHRVDHVSCRLFRQKDSTNIVVTKIGLRGRSIQLIAKAITEWSRRRRRGRGRTRPDLVQGNEAAGRAHVERRVAKRFGIAHLGSGWTSSQSRNQGEAEEEYSNFLNVRFHRFLCVRLSFAASFALEIQEWRRHVPRVNSNRDLT